MDGVTAYHVGIPPAHDLKLLQRMHFTSCLFLSRGRRRSRGLGRCCRRLARGRRVCRAVDPSRRRSGCNRRSGRQAAGDSRARRRTATGAITKAAGEVGDSWHGSAAHAFAGYMQRFSAAASTVHAGVDNAATDPATSRDRRVEREGPAQLDRRPDPRRRRPSGRARRTIRTPSRSTTPRSAAPSARGAPRPQPVVTQLAAAARAGGLGGARGVEQSRLPRPDRGQRLDLPAAAGQADRVEPDPEERRSRRRTAPASAASSAGRDGRCRRAGVIGQCGAPARMPTGDVAQWIAEARRS